MPPKPTHDDHEPKRPGPKERELAVALTVAVLQAARIDEPLASIESLARDIYARMLATVSNGAAREPQPIGEAGGVVRRAIAPHERDAGGDAQSISST